MRLKFLPQKIFSVYVQPDVVPRTIGFNVTPPAIVPDTTKAADPILQTQIYFLEIFVSLLE